ncbi:glutamine--fructose-6-phosphate transaminase (isomerizing), partial [Candidatus Woesearchaeota archaeon]|nr:glutamine--fructose-6-phosphate transaminase (isomerizing) [Candidatus Woesearchaeota archaeon]
MCGIIGYVGPKDGSSIVIEGLKKLEYRGYDSWGIAVKGSSLAVQKQVGKISDFDALDSLPKGSVAVGHTRWATNGSVTQANAHPHTCCKGTVAVVHNGIIENFQELKQELAHHSFSSETDTEIIAHLVEENMEAGMGFETAVKNALTRLEGRFAVVAVSEGSKKVIAARKGSPLVLGIGENEYFVASDIPAFLEHTRNVVFLEDGDVATISDGVSYSDFYGGKLTREPVEISWSVEQASLEGHEHYMIKEILEQRSTVGLAVSQDDAKILKVAKMINDAHGTFFIGCGTAGKVGMVGSYIFSTVAKKHVNDVVGSEFPNYHDFLTPET